MARLITCNGCLKITEHMAKGLCNPCYQKEYKKNPEKKEIVKKGQRDWYLRQDKEKYRLYREEKNFSGKRKEVLERDNFSCTECGSGVNLVVHHKDFNGRGRKVVNNGLDNLTTVCRSCHVKIHTPRWRGDVL